MFKNIRILQEAKNCDKKYSLAMLEVLNVFSGKWRMIIICSLLHGDIRFSEIQKLIPNITPRMLTKELKELQLSGIVKRTVTDSTPVLIQYSLTDSAKELTPIVIQLVEWGIRHRENSIGK